MKVNKLLQTQIKRFLPADMLNQEQVMQFLDAVSNTYNLYQQEIPAEIAPTTEADATTPPSLKSTNKKEAAAKQAVTALQEEESLLSNAVKTFTHLVTSLNSGIILEDEHRRIKVVNQVFLDIFQITRKPEEIIGTNNEDAVQRSKHLFKDPYEFVTRVDLLLAAKKPCIGEELLLADGRVIRRDFIPVFIENEYRGQVWKFEDVTKQKENQENLQRLSLVASANENGVAFSDATGTILWANEGFCKMLGYTNNEVIGKNALTLCIGPLSDRESISRMAEAFLAGRNFLVDIIQYRKDGSWFWSRLKGQAVLDEQGKVSQYFAMMEDISQEKEQGEELKVLSLIAEENMNAVVIMNAEGRITWVNKSFIKLTGYAPDEVHGKKPGEFCYGADTNKQTIACIEDAIKNGRSFNCELLNYNRMGRHYWVRIQGQPLRNSQGELTGFFSLEEDITSQVESQIVLKEYESRFRKAFETIGDNVWEHDFEKGQTYFSNTKSHLLGYEIDEFTDNKNLWWDRTHRDDAHLIYQNDDLYKKGEIDHHIMEYRVLHKDGSIRWVMDRGVVIEKDEKGLPLKIIGTHTDVTERKLNEELLQTKEEKYRSIIANMNLGLMEVDIEEKILFANQSFCDMSGYEYDELIGKRASYIFTKGESIEMIESKNEARKKVSSDAYEIAIKDKRGRLRWWLLSSATRYDKAGNLVGSIGIYLDITDQKQLELDLIEAREQAEGSTRSKEMFLANMSHEIRTPMNAILGMAQQLAKTKLDSKQLFYLDTINSASENLLVIINDILDLSKIEAGKLNLEHIGFEPQSAITRAMQVLMHKAEEKGLSITNSKLDTNLSPVLMGDPYRLNQVLLNLMSNSIKFTEKGGVDLACLVVKDTPTAQTIYVQVKDTGIGMEDDFVKNLFDKFSQEDLSVTRQYGGTGLGMSICKDLIELMGGEIMVESKKGIGTTVSFVVEFAKGTSADLPSKQNIFINNGMLADKRILVVDDNNMNRLVATTILNNYGAITTEAVNGKEAVEMIRKHCVDLVLMDIQMPIMDGIEATKLVRSEVSTSLPIIALTANAIKGDNDKCIAAGMNAYLSKPFKEEDLLKTVALWLGKGLSAFKPKHDIVEEDRGCLYDLSSIRTISRGNEGFVEKMVHMFIEQTPKQVEEMEMNFNEGNYKAMGAIAHRIKPSIDNMGIASLKEPIREIERIGKHGEGVENLEILLGTVVKDLGEVIDSLLEEFAIKV